MKLIDKNGKVFGKINIVDLIVIVVIAAAAVVFAASRVNNYLGDRQYEIEMDKEEKSKRKMTMEFYTDEVADYVIEHVKKGEILYDSDYNVEMGKVVSFKVEPSKVYQTNADGEIVETTKEGYSSLTIVGEVEAVKKDYGVEIDKVIYGVGHTMTLRTGNAKIYLKVSDIK